MTALLGKCMHI